MRDVGVLVYLDMAGGLRGGWRDRVARMVCRGGERTAYALGYAKRRAPRLLLPSHPRRLRAGPDTGAVVPIYATSTYKQDGVGGLRGGASARSANPAHHLEKCIASLEGGERGFTFASGLAARTPCSRSVLRPGDHAVVPAMPTATPIDCSTRWSRAGIEHSIAKIADLDSVRAVIARDQADLDRVADQPRARH